VQSVGLEPTLLGLKPDFKLEPNCLPHTEFRLRPTSLCNLHNSAYYSLQAGGFH